MLHVPPTLPCALLAAALGRLTTAYTIGATVGPTVGGYLGTTGDLYRGARLAVGVSLCVEINQCVGCTAVRKLHCHAVEQAS